MMPDDLAATVASLGERLGALELQTQMQGERITALEELHEPPPVPELTLDGFLPGALTIGDPAQLDAAVTRNRFEQATALLEAEFGAYILIVRQADGNVGAVSTFAGDIDNHLRANAKRALAQVLEQEG